MDQQQLEHVCKDCHDALQQVLGYLNFSSGSPDPQFLQNLNELFELLDESREESRQEKNKRSRRLPTWRQAGNVLRLKIDSLRGEEPAFSDATQANSVLDMVFDVVIPNYREFHTDLLGHQSSELLFNAFMVGRICEAVLRQEPPWEDAEKVAAVVIGYLNDYVGHRPIATLESRKHEPYRHEWTRPIPLYVQQAGTVCGPYHELVSRAIRWLELSRDELPRDAYFDLNRLDELAMDARAYDFEHPVNKRPNYQFGQWDPHCIDNRGYYRRFVVQQVTMDALLSRAQREKDLPETEFLDEAAAVLAGTLLMASGVSGSGPTSHDSETTLSTLLPGIAEYRDAFYEQLLDRFPKDHADRLRAEASKLHQPFGAARQHLNRELAQRRANQLERAQLARLFAKMGYPDEARSMSRDVTVTSARMACRIDCLLTACEQAIQRDELELAAKDLNQAAEHVHRAIDCGAMVDPWNMLGFDANFALFPALENTVYDHRVDELIETVEQTFALYANVWGRAAAADNQELCLTIRHEFEELTNWWHKFAAHEVHCVGAPSARDTFQAANKVSEALNLWHKGGAATGDVKFWAPFADMFGSAQSYDLVLKTLLANNDFVASMGLLVHWLSQANDVELESGEASFHRISVRWLKQLMKNLAFGDGRSKDSARSSGESARSRNLSWSLVAKFFDFLEANADEYWLVPDFQLDSSQPRRSDVEDDQLAGELDESDDEELFGAAYENVVYRDSTDDGMDSQIFDPDTTTGDEFESESERIVDRVAFLATLARLWSFASQSATTEESTGHDGFGDRLEQWLAQSSRNRQDLMSLLDEISGHVISSSATDHDSMVQYDRKRLIKESLLDQVIAACVETIDAERFLRMAIADNQGQIAEDGSLDLSEFLDEDERLALTVLHHARQGDSEYASRYVADLIGYLSQKPILYVPLNKGGKAHEIVAAQSRRRLVELLLVSLPRLGLLSETRELLEVIRKMERNVPVGPGAVTQFDELFEKGHRAMVEMISHAADVTIRTRRSQWDEAGHDDSTRRLLTNTIESELIDCLERVTESMLVSWLAHSRTLRLSVLEKVNNEERWQELVKFINAFGHDIFTQHFLNLANLRAILHQGVDDWLERVDEQSRGARRWPLLDEIQDSESRERVVKHLSFILEAVVENYAEYREYNSTTTQSDRGEMLYALLDFMRLRSTYDRVAWNLKPVTSSHEILVRRGHNGAAQLWRRALNDRISEEADRFVKRLRKLQSKYAMRIATVADRIGERFMRTLIIDRMRALVEPAMHRSTPQKADHAFEILKEETSLMVREPTGSGLETPPWLAALKQEVEQIQCGQQLETHLDAWEQTLSQVPLTLDDVQQQLDGWKSS